MTIVANVGAVMPRNVRGNLRVDGIPELERTFERFTSRRFEKLAFDEPSNRALRSTVLPVSKQNAMSTHPRSIHRGEGSDRDYIDRYPNAALRWRGRRLGPMSRFQRVFNLRRGVGSKIDYTRASLRHMLVKRPGKSDFFYPAAQEYMAPTANPPITGNASQPMGRATRSHGRAAIGVLNSIIGPFIDRAVESNRVSTVLRGIR